MSYEAPSAQAPAGETPEAIAHMMAILSNTDGQFGGETSKSSNVRIKRGGGVGAGGAMDDGFVEVEPCDFEYSDSDTLANELRELYSYSERNDFCENRRAFEEDCGGRSWLEMSALEKQNYVLSLLERFELLDSEKRLIALRCSAYVAQGCFGDCHSTDEVLEMSLNNCVLMFESGFIAPLFAIADYEISNPILVESSMNRSSGVCIADSIFIRLALDAFYTIIETIRQTQFDRRYNLKYRDTLAQLKDELMTKDDDGNILVFHFFELIHSFCSGRIPFLPIRKILLCIWKILLTTLGVEEDLLNKKLEMRKVIDLPMFSRETTVKTISRVRASSPPRILPYDFNDDEPKRSKARKTPMMKQGPLEGDSKEEDVTKTADGAIPPGTPRPGSPIDRPCPRTSKMPWTPKIRESEVEAFLNVARMKYLGFKVRGDLVTMKGLPKPTCEAVANMKRNIYRSVAEHQMKREEMINRFPFSQPDVYDDGAAAEVLYRSIHPNLTNYVLAMLKILLAASPPTKKKAEQSAKVSCIADCMPEQMPVTVSGTLILGVDCNRHKHILVKAIVSIILILLKHFKLNHIYQYECLSQHLVFANCIPLLLKFITQDLTAFVTAKTDLVQFSYPDCFFTDDSIEVTPDNIECLDESAYCWRNIFATINVLRILNKLSKWKPSRTVMLVVFKSAPVLRRALRVKESTVQLYALKLIKMQARYLGRQWRKNNMKTVTAIYEKVRHRYADDWAYGAETDQKPWEFQQEESALRAKIEAFNQRRYGCAGSEARVFVTPDMPNIDWTPVNCSLPTLLLEKDSLSDEFKQNCREWAQREVMENEIDWMQLIERRQRPPTNRKALSNKNV